MQENKLAATASTYPLYSTIAPPFSAPHAGAVQRERCIFKTISALAAHDLYGIAEVVQTRRGQVLHDIGHVIHYVYLLTVGLVSVSIPDGKNGPIEVLTVGSGEFVGLPHSLGMGKSPYRTVALTSGEALRIPVAGLKQLAGIHETLNKALLSALGSIVLHGSILVACNARHSLRQRVVRWLLTASDQIASANVLVTHDMLAHAIGVRRAGVTTELGFLQCKGIVECARGSLKLIDRERLESMACGCHSAIKTARMRAVECN